MNKIRISECNLLESSGNFAQEVGGSSSPSFNAEISQLREKWTDAACQESITLFPACIFLLLFFGQATKVKAV